METVDCRSSAVIKIALFRSLFRGRDDVYPRRFESRGTASPAGHYAESGRDCVKDVEALFQKLSKGDGT